MKIAAIQMVSTTELQANLDTAQDLIQRAALDGAEMILLPEYWPIMGQLDTDKLTLAEAPGKGEIQDFLYKVSRDLGVWIIAGTIPLISHESGKVFNTTLVYNPQGEQVARYDKIHLFGFTKGDESYQESRTIVEGNTVVSFDAPFGKVGLAICYDLRFPELFRAMGTCSLIVVPAAFTHTTGQAHWEILLRARAIENQCYVLASAQGGKHENGRRTWGHSMLIDPWGKIVAQLAEGEGYIVGEIDDKLIQSLRENLPALRHRKL
jgi:deaminated glutathione amidase